MICPHCLAVGISAGVASIPIVPVAFRALKLKFSRHNKEK